MENADFYAAMAVDAELRKLQWRMKLEDLRADRLKKQAASRRQAVFVRNAVVQKRIDVGYSPIATRTRSAPRRRAVGLMKPRILFAPRCGPIGSTRRADSPFRLDLAKMIKKRRALPTIIE